MIVRDYPVRQTNILMYRPHNAPGTFPKIGKQGAVDPTPMPEIKTIVFPHSARSFYIDKISGYMTSF